MEKQAETVIAVCEMEHSPLWSNTLPEDGCLEGFIRIKGDVPRQGLPQYYRVNGAIYMANVKLILEEGNLYGKNGYAYIMDKKYSMDIDDELDFVMAEFLMG